MGVKRNGKWEYTRSKRVWNCSGEGVQQRGVEVNEDKLPVYFWGISIRPWANVICRACWRNASVMPILWRNERSLAHTLRKTASVPRLKVVWRAPWRFGVGGERDWLSYVFGEQAGDGAMGGETFPFLNNYLWLLVVFIYDYIFVFRLVHSGYNLCTFGADLVS